MKMLKIVVGIAAISYASGFIVGFLGPNSAEDWHVLLDRWQMWARIELEKYENEEE